MNVSVKRVGGAYGSKISRSHIVTAACALGAHVTGKLVFPHNMHTYVYVMVCVCAICILYVHERVMHRNIYSARFYLGEEPWVCPPLQQGSLPLPK